MGPLLDPTPRQTPESILGGALGQGIARNFPQPEMMVQRGLLQDAFNKAKKTAGKEGASPLDVAFDFLQATAGIPGAERYVGQVLPLVMQQAKAQRGAGVEPVGGMPQPGGEGMPPPEQAGPPGGPGGPPPGEQVEGPVSSQQFLQQSQSQVENLPPPLQDQSNLFSGALDPTELGMGPIPQTYSAEQIQQATIEDANSGFPESPRAQMMEQYNELARKETGDLVKAAGDQAKVAEMRRQGQDAFRGVLGQVLNTNNPMKLALAENIANKPRYRKFSNDVIRADKIKPEYDKINQKLDGFINSSVRPSPFLPWSRSQYFKNFDSLRKNSQPLIREGMRPQLSSELARNKWSQTEVEQILNPLGERLIKDIDGIEKFPQIGSVMTTGFDAKTVQRNTNRVNKKWENFLSKNIKPGKIDPHERDVLQPGTSLVLLRNEYMQKGGNWEDFESMVNDLRESGKIRLDDFQENEMNTLIRRPVQSLTFEEFLLGTRRL